jgi:hypothetical protein
MDVVMEEKRKINPSKNHDSSQIGRNINSKKMK